MQVNTTTDDHHGGLRSRIEGQTWRTNLTPTNPTHSLVSSFAPIQRFDSEGEGPPGKGENEKQVFGGRRRQVG